MPSKPIGCSRANLQEYLPAEFLIPYQPIGEEEWGRLRKKHFRRLLRHFFNFGNVIRFRGKCLLDLAGFSWAGIYRSMLLPEIVAASFKNEGHFRAQGRIAGTEKFFGGAFAYARGGERLRKVISIVNLRHHVAGVVRRKGDDVEVFPYYETAYAYVATALIESIRRGYEACGVPPNCPRGRAYGEDLCTILYQIAGMVGLTRMPKDLDAHERFRDSLENCLRVNPPSPWMRTQAQELAKRIFPFTAALSGISMEMQLQRHLDRTTAEYLFPDPAVLEELRPVYEKHRLKFKTLVRKYFLRISGLLGGEPTAPEASPTFDGLWEAYRKAPDDSTDARLIGAVLLYALDADPGSLGWTVPIPLRLEAGERLFEQGKTHDHCYIILKASEPLIITRRGVAGQDPEKEVEIARVTGPTLLGEIVMWRNRPAIATVSCPRAAELSVLRLGRKEFDALRMNSGFWNAVAAEVQRRLQISMQSLAESLRVQEARLRDPEFTSLFQLVLYLNGDVQARLDLVPGIHPETSLAQCVDLLRENASRLHSRTQADPVLRGILENLLDVIG